MRLRFILGAEDVEISVVGNMKRRGLLPGKEPLGAAEYFPLVENEDRKMDIIESHNSILIKTVREIQAHI